MGIKVITNDRFLRKGLTEYSDVFSSIGNLRGGSYFTFLSHWSVYYRFLFF